MQTNSKKHNIHHKPHIVWNEVILGIKYTAVIYYKDKVACYKGNNPKEDIPPILHKLTTPN